MSRKSLLFLIVAISQYGLAQNFADRISSPEEQQRREVLSRAADQIDAAKISRADALTITATFLETQAARNALKKSLDDYVRSIDQLDVNGASRLTKLLTNSEGQLRIMHSAGLLATALGRIDALADQFSLLAPNAAALATDYARAKKGPVVREASLPRLLPPSKQEAVSMLHTMEENDSAFEAAYSAFCERMERKFGYSFVTEAAEAALRKA